jgi:hypothetical protein
VDLAGEPAQPARGQPGEGVLLLDRHGHTGEDGPGARRAARVPTRPDHERGPDPEGEAGESEEAGDHGRAQPPVAPDPVTADRLEGTFAFDLEAGTGETLDVTEGSFDVPRISEGEIGIASSPAAVTGAGLPERSISIVTGGDRDELRQLSTQDGVVDLIIPRGGEGLKAALKEHATVPVMYAAAGNCHVFVDASANLEDAVAIAVNAKVQRPSVCNAAETLLVHAEVAADFLPNVLRELRERGVELRVDGRTRSVAGDLADSLSDATEEDWGTEYHALILAVIAFGIIATPAGPVETTTAYACGS